MKIFGWDIRRAKAPAASPSPWQLRANNGQGALTGGFANWVPRKIDAAFMEFLRESIPIIDAAICKLVILDGHVEVKGHNVALVDEIQEWLYNVPVNDVQKGVQAFDQSLSNEAFEQGFGLGEFVPNKQRTDIVGLRTADSKYIKFSRTAAGLDIFQKADGDMTERKLHPETLIYFSINNENQNPYGIPQFRSCEFVSKCLATMNNSVLNVWERFGDPSFEIIYKTSKADGADHEARRKTIQDDFTRAMTAKRSGQSADFIRAIDKNSDITIKIIGHDGQVLEIETPARHILEQIVAKSTLPGWMLGMHWSTTERLATFEVEMLLAAISTRQAAKLPHYYNLIRTLLLLRGRTWKKGDWWLEWKQVNLHDQVAQAQARFLNAQADMYYLKNAAEAGIEIRREDLSIGKGKAALTPALSHKGERGKCAVHGERHPLLMYGDWRDRVCSCGCGKDHFAGGGKMIPGNKESRPDPWPEIDAVETAYENRLKGDWKKFGEIVAGRLGLAGKGATPPAFGHPPCETGGAKGATGVTLEERAQILADLESFLGEYIPTGEDSPITWAYAQSYSLGLIQAAKLVGEERPILDILKNQEILAEMTATGFELVKQSATRAIVNKLLPEIEGLILSGAGPNTVADRLRMIFAEKNSDWERLARTELSMAAETAKINEWKAWGIEKVEFVTAPDGCPICVALAGVYAIDEAPVAGRDTHPRCRCAVRPVMN